jgi:hypothetical protein
MWIRGAAGRRHGYFGDACYINGEYKRGVTRAGDALVRPGQTQARTQSLGTSEEAQSETFLYPAQVEHVFRVIKWQFGFTKIRYRGLSKNTVQMNMRVGLVNLYLLRGGDGCLRAKSVRVPDTGRYSIKIRKSGDKSAEE